MEKTENSDVSSLNLETTENFVVASLNIEELSKSLFYIKDLHRYVNNAERYSTDKATDVVKMFNKAIDSLSEPVPIALYFVESSRSHPLETIFPRDSEYYRYVRDHLHVDQADNLKYTTFKQYCDYFYATDQHSNYQGSYQGYKDIVRMLFGDDEVLLEPSGVVTLPVIYNGSYAKNAHRRDSTEPFSLYRFDKLPK